MEPERHNGIEHDPEGAFVYYDDYAAFRAQLAAVEQHLEAQRTETYKAVEREHQAKRQLAEAITRRSETVAMCEQIQSELADAQATIARLEHATRTRADYDLRCQQCGAAHLLDTSIPSHIWNQIAKPGDILCLICIDERLLAHGLQCEAEFYFVGQALLSRMYNKDLITEHDILRETVRTLRAALEGAPTGKIGETHGDVMARYYAWYEGERQQALIPHVQE